MNVNVIVAESESDQVLARLARQLAKATGWNLSRTPNSKADINYFFPYLTWADFQDFKQTPTAAWFTHRDTAHSETKASIWDACARHVNMRTTSAQMYVKPLEHYGMTRIVTVPLSREQFAPSKPKRGKFTIGFSGYTYPGGRKGEHLVAELMRRIGDGAQFIASGRGWPCECRERDFSQLPAFYNSLSLYVCTSTIEGIGYPPLEAMACGIPIVVPRGVGVFDELPSVQFLYRYNAGDIDDLERAVREAMAEPNPVNVESLRGVTLRFTSDAWRDTHIMAFEDFLYGVRPVPTLPAWAEHSGVYVCAYGKPARECAVRLFTSLKRYMPGLPICLVSDRALGAGEDVFVRNNDEDIGSRSAKTKIYDLAPREWDYVLYLDADTEIVGSIAYLFELLQDGWELVFCTNPAQYHIARTMVRPDNQDECEATWKQLGTDEILQFNGGVFSFRRNDRTERFFRNWHTEWKRWAKRDQAALDRALYAHPLRVFVLSGRVWNCVTRYWEPDGHEAILHYPMQARRWRGLINGRLDSSEAWAAVHPDSR